MTQTFPAALTARFRPGRLLGAGGYGAVWQATQVDLDRPVALKLLNGALSAQDDEVARFLDEAKITARLSHPAIVKVLDFGVVEGCPWIAYELLTGSSLAARADGGALPVAEAARLLAEVARGLAEAHAAGIVHRDIKPENVFVDARGEARLTDFGIARWSGSTRVKTATGVVLGSPAYLAPEVIQGEAPGPAADLYALGVSFYQLVAGRLPFEHPTILGLLEQQVNADPPPLPAGSPAAAQALVERALAKRPRFRHASATELAAALDALAQGPRAATTTTPVRSRPSRPTAAIVRGDAPRAGAAPARARPSAPARAVPVAGVAALAALLVAALALGRRTPPPAPTPAPTTASAAATPVTTAPPARPLHIDDFEYFEGSTSARIRMRLREPERLTVDVEPAERPGAAFRSQTPSPIATTRYAFELLGLPEHRRFRLVFRTDRRERLVVPINTVRDNDTRAMRFELAAEGPGVSLQPLRGRRHLPTNELARQITPLALEFHANLLLDVAENWDSPELAKACLDTHFLAPGSAPELRAIAVLAKSRGAPARPLLDAWLAHRTGDPSLYYARAIEALLAVEPFEAERFDRRVTFEPAPVESTARALVAADPAAARRLFEHWVPRPLGRGLIACMGFAVLGDAKSVAAIAKADELRCATLALCDHPDARRLVRERLATDPPSDSACWAVARRPDPLALPRVVHLASDSDRAVRIAALCTLGRLGDAAAAAASLRAGLAASDPLVRRAAAWAAGRLRAVDLRAALIEMISEGRDTDGVAAWALGELGDPADRTRLAAIAQAWSGSAPSTLRNQTRVALAVLGLWRLAPGEALALLRALPDARYSGLLRDLQGVFEEHRSETDSLDVLFPFSFWDESRASYRAHALVEVRALNLTAWRGTRGTLVPVRTHWLRSGTYESSPCVYRPDPCHIGDFRVTLPVQADGPLLMSPLDPATAPGFGGGELDLLGGAIVMRVRRLWSPP